jgi:hypothetical protein
MKGDADRTRRRVFRGGPQRLSVIRKGKKEELGLPRRFNMSQYKEDVPKNQKDMSEGSQVAAHDDEKG